MKYGDDFGLGVLFFVWEVKEAVSVVWTSLSRVFSTSSSVFLTIVNDRWWGRNGLRVKYLPYAKCIARLDFPRRCHVPCFSDK